MTINEMWNCLTENQIATESELSLVTCINGYSEESMRDVLYARTGYRNFDQLEDFDS